MGGMAAQIPIKGDEAANQQAMERVYADKKREALAGHDGTWVAHPGLIPIALDAFDQYMPGANQLDKIPDSVTITSEDLLKVPAGDITETGVRNNISVALLYLESWLMGNGCVPIRYLMEDAATAEICRAQLWQWLKFSAPLADGSKLNATLMHKWMNEEYKLLIDEYDKAGRRTDSLATAKELLEKMIFNVSFDEFLTTQAYPYLIHTKDH
jgi:malate synthase